MGRVSISSVISALDDGGFPTEHAYPAEKMPCITQPVAAVRLLTASLKGQTMTVVVTILCPGDAGGVTCEEKALEAATILSGIGGDCTVKKCGFDSRMGLYCADVYAKFLTEIPTVSINNKNLRNVVAFTSWRAWDPELQQENLLEAPWNFRLEEFFAIGAEEDSDCTEPFELVHYSYSGSEIFQGCKWTYQKRIWGPTGVRQIRLGTAELMDNG